MIETSRAWVEIDVEKLKSNYEKVKSFVSPSSVMAIAKAEAYGHGAVPFCRTLAECGCEAYAVAAVSEAINLRKNGIKGVIFVLGWSDPAVAKEICENDITVSAVSYNHALNMSKTGYPVKMHVAIDTGMNRLGEPYDSEMLEKIYSLPSIVITGSYSHLAMADSINDTDVAFTELQIKRFDETVKRLKDRGARVGRLHLQASYGIVNQAENHYDYVRPGLLLFGIKSLESDTVQNDLSLSPALSLRARVASVKKVKSGSPAGYNRHFTASRDSVIADVTVGYCDFLPRNYFQNGGYILIKGKRAPVVDLCMDQLLADVTDIDGVCEGDTVTLIGSDGAEHISAEQIAKTCGTISNEIVSRIHSRVGVVYK